jgi:hypothetical protein
MRSSLTSSAAAPALFLHDSGTNAFTLRSVMDLTPAAKFLESFAS